MPNYEIIRGVQSVEQVPKREAVKWREMLEAWDRRAVASTPSLIYGTRCTRRALLADSYWMQQAYSGDWSVFSCPVNVFSFSSLLFSYC